MKTIPDFFTADRSISGWIFHNGEDEFNTETQRDEKRLSDVER